jgi:hypothetical protein
MYQLATESQLKSAKYVNSFTQGQLLFPYLEIYNEDLIIFEQRGYNS